MSSISLGRRAVLAAGGLASASLVGLRGAGAQGAPVKVGELNSYARMAAFSVPYRNAIQLAVDEINRAGGVLGGRPLEAQPGGARARTLDAL